MMRSDPVIPEMFCAKYANQLKNTIPTVQHGHGGGTELPGLSGTV